MNKKGDIIGRFLVFVILTIFIIFLIALVGCNGNLEGSSKESSDEEVGDSLWNSPKPSHHRTIRTMDADRASYEAAYNSIFSSIIKNMSVCKSLSDPEDIEMCYIDTKVLCEPKYYGTSFDKDRSFTFHMSWCNERISLALEDIYEGETANDIESENYLNFCEYFVDEDHFFDCRLNYAIYYDMNHSICSEVKYDSQKSDCYKEIALLSNNISLCNSIPYSIEKDYCILDLAKLNNDISLCSRIDSTISRDNCHYYFAEQNNDAALCSEIESQSQKYECEKKLAIT